MNSTIPPQHSTTYLTQTPTPTKQIDQLDLPPLPRAVSTASSVNHGISEGRPACAVDGFVGLAKIWRRIPTSKTARHDLQIFLTIIKQKLHSQRWQTIGTQKKYSSFANRPNNTRFTEDLNASAGGGALCCDSCHRCETWHLLLSFNRLIQRLCLLNFQWFCFAVLQCFEIFYLVFFRFDQCVLVRGFDLLESKTTVQRWDPCRLPTVCWCLSVALSFVWILHAATVVR